MKNISSRLFGPIEYKEDQVLTFSKGLLGFQKPKDGHLYTKFVLKRKAATDPITWLICVEEGGPELALMNPVGVEPDYTLADIKISIEARYALRGNPEAIDLNDLVMFGVVTVPKNIRQMSIDLRAPILIDKKTKRGAQFSISSRNAPRWPVRKNLYHDFVLGRPEDKEGMLVIYRKVNETIDIGDATMQVLEVDGNGVRFGVTAPQRIKVLRGDHPVTPAGENLRANSYVNLKDLEAVVHMNRVIRDSEQMPTAHGSQRMEERVVG